MSWNVREAAIDMTSRKFTAVTLIEARARQGVIGVHQMSFAGNGRTAIAHTPMTRYRRSKPVASICRIVHE